MADTMAHQRACKKMRAARRALEAERQTPGQGRVVDSINGFWIVEQHDRSYTIQRGLRVRGAGCGWTRQQAEAAAAAVTVKLTNEYGEGETHG